VTTGKQEQGKACQQGGDEPQSLAPRKKYSPPRILSAEPLEAAAATCAPPVGGFGKTTPFPCGTLGS
jgi:hypothetical protein